MRLRHFAGERQQHGKTQFRRCHGVAAGRIHHHNTVLRGSFHVHVVHTDTRAPDNAQFRRSLNDFARHLGLGTNDQRNCIRHNRQQFRLGQSFGQHDHLKLRTLLEQRDAFG